MHVLLLQDMQLHDDLAFMLAQISTYRSSEGVHALAEGPDESRHLHIGHVLRSTALWDRHGCAALAGSGQARVAEQARHERRVGHAGGHESWAAHGGGS